MNPHPARIADQVFSEDVMDHLWMIPRSESPLPERLSPIELDSLCDALCHSEVRNDAAESEKKRGQDSFIWSRTPEKRVLTPFSSATGGLSKFGQFGKAAMAVDMAGNAVNVGRGEEKGTGPFFR